MAFLGAHDPRDVELLVGGLRVQDSFGEGDIEIERANDIFTPMSGFQGDLHIELSMDKTGTMTIPIKAGSKWSVAFDEMQGLAETGAPLAVFPVMFKNKKTNIQIITVGWIQTQAGISEGASRGDRSVVIGLADCSPSVISKATDIVNTLASWIA